MSIRFLIFQGNWEDEGNFCLLEDSESIIVLATGQNFSLTRVQEQQLGRDYLKENRSKVKAIIVNNTSWQNIGLLPDICGDLGFKVPIYTSFYNKLILFSLFPRFRNKITVVEKNREIKVGDFSCCFLPIGSYIIGNLAFKINHSQYSFYFLEAFVFSNLLDNNLLFPSNFLQDFQQFLTQQKKNTYLITSCQGMHWKNDNSLFFAAKNFPSLGKPLFFILYDFDWLHILELLEIGRKREKKIRILDEKSAQLVNQILTKNPLQKVIENEKNKKESDKIYLLVGNPENIRKKLDNYLSNLSPEKRTNFNFIIGTPPVIGGERELAKLIDYLYSQGGEITNLSKKECCQLGVNFYDLKLLLKLLKPIRVITLQNSYKYEKFTPYLPGSFSLVENGRCLDFPNQKFSPLKVKQSLINLEELLVKQKENLGQNGLLIFLLITQWEEKKLQLKSLKIESLALSSLLNISKLENKVKSWWTTNLIRDIEKDDPPKIIKRTIEKRLNRKVNNYLNLEHDIEIEESLILLFNQKKELKKPE